MVSRMPPRRIRSAGSRYSARILMGRAATLLRNSRFRNASSSLVIGHSPDDPFLFKLSGLAVRQADDDLVSLDRFNLDLSMRGQVNHVTRPDLRLFSLT